MLTMGECVRAYLLACLARLRYRRLLRTATTSDTFTVAQPTTILQPTVSHVH